MCSHAGFVSRAEEEWGVSKSMTQANELSRRRIFPTPHSCTPDRAIKEIDEKCTTEPQ